MSDRSSKVIGYFAYFSPERVVCADRQSCVIAGSEIEMKEYVNERFPHEAKSVTIKKTRFGEILLGLKAGAAYAFDEESYGRFYPLAVEEGIPVAPQDFSAARERGERFSILELKSL